MLNVALQCRGTETTLEANAEYMEGEQWGVESRERKVSNHYFFPQNRYGHAYGCVWDSKLIFGLLVCPNANSLG